MLLQTNSYIVPKEKRATHASLLLRFRETLARLGCEVFEIYEQVGTDWDSSLSNGRFVQIIRFRDREHQRAVQAAESSDRDAQLLIAEFCELINFPYQQEHGFFAVGFYTNILSAAGSSDVTADDAAITEIDDDFSDFEPDDLVDAPASLMRLVANDASTEQDMPAKEPGGEADIGSVLDAGLKGDALDIPLAAELFEDEEVAAPLPLPTERRGKPKGTAKKVSGRR